MIKVKCISNRLNHVHFVTQGDGSRKAVKIKEGDTFTVKAIPKEWRGLVIPVGGEEPVKQAVTNPAQGEELEALKAEYKELTGKGAHYTWDAETLKERIAEAKKAD